ncbi:MULTISPECIES: DUF6157 family protein [unclassified Pedobacter]|uniref:DUF6157 family protein n=1 Tax=unclassified Pedobacter TaxID=2628915 RepID=UPI001E2B3838|nr:MULTISPECIES: DUF6157 family protein [unclassified Pedobacter]
MKDKLHSTNYYNTFIEIAEDSKAISGSHPKAKGKDKTIAEIQFEIIAKNPYKYTSDDVLFNVFIERSDISKEEENDAKVKFFSKGQACFRASPLTKQYGFGLHANNEGKIALFGMETKEYQQFLADNNIKKIKAMRSAKK